VQAFVPPDTLETVRLRLRRPRPADAPAVFRFGSDPQVTRYMTWPTHRSLEDARAFLAGCDPDWEAGREHTWMITVRPSDEAVGTLACSLREGELAVGFVLAQEQWGRGYATEAATRLLQWARGAGLRRIVATCDADNAASARVLRKLGLRREGSLPGGLVRPNLEKGPREAWIFANTP
jgi:ribosomal-protein-alanine N-acetyltransferase